MAPNRLRRRLIIAFSAFLLIFTTVIFLPSLFRNEVSSIVLTEMNENLDAHVSFSDADINLWRHFPNFTFSFENFLITGKEHFKGDTLLQTSEFHLVLSSWRFILLGEVEIRELNLHHPQVHIMVLENGETNYDIVQSGSETDSTDNFVLKIESCEVNDGRLTYEDRESKTLLTGSSIQLAGDFNVEGSVTAFRLAGIAEHSNLSYDKKKYIVNKDIVLNLDASYNSTTNQFTFVDNNISINQLAINFDGSYTYENDGHLVDMKFKTVDADFADIISLNDVLMKDLKKMDVRGILSLEGNIHGIYNSQFVPTFDVSMNVSNGHLQYKHLSKALNNIHLELKASNNDSIWSHSTLDLTRFSLNVGDNPFHGKAQIVGLTNGSITSDIQATIKLEDVGAIYPIEGLSMTGDVNVALQSSGSYSGKIQNIFSSARQVPKFQLNLAVNNAGMKYDRLPEAITEMHLLVKAQNVTGNVDDTKLSIEKINGLFGDNPLKGFVHIEGLKNPQVRSELLARLDLSEIQNFYPISGTELKGLLDIDLKVQGELNDSLKRFPLVNAMINLKNGYVKSDAYPAPIENAHLLLHAINESGNVRDTRFLIDTLTYTLDEETFLIEGSVSDLEKYNYDLAVSGKLYLDKLNAILKIPDWTMAGEVDVNFRTAGNLSDLKAKRYHQLPTSGHLKMIDLHLKAAMLPHEVRIRQGHMSFSNEKILLDTLHGTIGTSAFNVSGHLYNYLAYVFHSNEKIKGDLLFQSDFFSLNELLVDDHQHRDTVHHDLATFAVPANIDFTFDSKIKKLEYKDIDLENFDGEVVLREGVVTLHKTTFDILESEFLVSGNYDGRDAVRPAFDVQLKITDLDINKAHTTFATVQTLAPAAEHTFGIFSVDYNLKGNLHPNLHPIFESLTGGGTVSIRDAQVNGMKVFHHISGITKREELMNPTLKNIVMETNVENGVLYVKPFSMKLAGFDTDIEGQHLLSGAMNYVLKIAIPPFDIVRIPLHVNGTYDNPKIHLGKGHEEAFTNASYKK